MEKSNYAKYLLERANKFIYEDERGFAVYFFLPQSGICYIEDIFVDSNFRRKGVASFYADEITKIARAQGCTHLMGSVQPGVPGATESMKALLAYGFYLDSVDSKLVYLLKNI